MTQPRNGTSPTRFSKSPSANAVRFKSEKAVDAALSDGLLSFTDASNPVPFLTQGDAKRSNIYYLQPNETLTPNKVAVSFQRHDRVKILVKSIREYGQMESGLVYQHPNGNLEHIKGLSSCLACRELGQPYAYQITQNLGRFECTDDYVAAEYEASLATRQSSAGVRALDAARLCRDVFEPKARKRMTAGKAAEAAEKGKSHELAAKAASVTPSSVKVALEIIDTEVEPLVVAGTPLGTAKRILKLKDSSLRKVAIEAARKGDKKELARILRAGSQSGPHLTVPARLRDVFEVSFDAPIKKLKEIEKWLRSTIESDAGRVLRPKLSPKHIEKIIELINSSKPKHLCPDHEATGSPCHLCPEGKGWLTEREFAQLRETNKQSSKSVIKPRNGRV